MSKKKYNHLRFWEKCMKTGTLPSYEGLCFEAEEEKRIDFDLLKLFFPTSYDIEWIKWDGHCPTMWASGLPEDSPGEFGDFTPLRQTIVLFMAAMNREL